MAKQNNSPKRNSAAHLSAAITDTIAAVARSVAQTAVDVLPLAGRGDSKWIDGLASAELPKHLHSHLPSLYRVKYCEGAKDKAPMIMEGTILGRGKELSG